MKISAAPFSFTETSASAGSAKGSSGYGDVFESAIRTAEKGTSSKSASREGADPIAAADDFDAEKTADEAISNAQTRDAKARRTTLVGDKGAISTAEGEDKRESLESAADATLENPGESPPSPAFSLLGKLFGGFVTADARNAAPQPSTDLQEPEGEIVLQERVVVVSLQPGVNADDLDAPRKVTLEVLRMETHFEPRSEAVVLVDADTRSVKPSSTASETAQLASQAKPGIVPRAEVPTGDVALPGAAGLPIAKQAEARTDQSVNQDRAAVVAGEEEAATALLADAELPASAATAASRAAPATLGALPAVREPSIRLRFDEALARLGTSPTLFDPADRPSADGQAKGASTAASDRDVSARRAASMPGLQDAAVGDEAPDSTVRGVARQGVLASETGRTSTRGTQSDGVTVAAAGAEAPGKTEAVARTTIEGRAENAGKTEDAVGAKVDARADVTGKPETPGRTDVDGTGKLTGRSEAAAKAEAAARTDVTGKAETAGQPETVSKADSARRAEISGRTDVAGRPEGSGKSDTAAGVPATGRVEVGKPEVGGRAETVSRAESSGKADVAAGTEVSARTGTFGKTEPVRGMEVSSASEVGRKGEPRGRTEAAGSADKSDGTRRADVSEKTGLSGEKSVALAGDTAENGRGAFEDRPAPRSGPTRNVDGAFARNADDKAEARFAPAALTARIDDSAKDGASPLASMTDQVAGRIIDTLGAVSTSPRSSERTSGDSYLRFTAGGAALKTLTIQLQPENLGVLDVSMRLIDGQLTLELAASEANTAKLLAEDQEGLRKLLQHAGFSMDEASITIVTRDPSADSRIEVASANASARQDGNGGSGANGSHSGTSDRDARQSEGGRRQNGEGGQGAEARGSESPASRQRNGAASTYI